MLLNEENLRLKAEIERMEGNSADAAGEGRSSSSGIKEETARLLAEVEELRAELVAKEEGGAGEGEASDDVLLDQLNDLQMELEVHKHEHNEKTQETRTPFVHLQENEITGMSARAIKRK